MAEPEEAEDWTVELPLGDGAPPGSRRRQLAIVVGIVVLTIVILAALVVAAAALLDEVNDRAQKARTSSPAALLFRE